MPPNVFKRWRKYCWLYCIENNTSPPKVTNKTAVASIANRLDIFAEARHVGIEENKVFEALKKIFPRAFQNQNVSLKHRTKG